MGDNLEDYVGVWGWQILSVIFLVGGLITYALKNDVTSSAIAVALIVASLGCQTMMIKRKKELEVKNG